MNENLTKLYIDRIEKFYQRIGRQILGDWIPFQAIYSWSKEPISFSQRLNGDYRPIKEGDVWGQAWENAWFRLSARVPSEWQGQTVVAQLDFTGEGLVVDPDGLPIQGITRGSVFDSNFSRDIVRLFDACAGGEEVELWVETAGNDLFGLYMDLDPAPDEPNRFGHFECRVNRMRLCVFNQELWHLWLDMEILQGLIKRLPKNSVRRARIIRNVNDAIDAFKDDPARAHLSRKVLKKELSKPAASSDLSACAVGHAHIDTAWLWPVQEAVRKCARTFASQISLLERYPQYVFGASQPQHYVFVKETYPRLYGKIKELVEQGRWEPQGGMWVESDCNLISGESMIRQILYGKNFFRDEFGVDVKNLWLPDVFGYPASMPQIMKKSGIDFFLTQKLSWNRFNKFPHHTFRWRGIDGSEVITHFPPEDTYNSMLNTEHLLFGRDNFKEKDFIDEFLCLFGVGDGGGGPKEENIEYGLRMTDLEGAPRIRFGRAQDFFEGLEKYRDQLAIWSGELYLEIHRGTLTTQAYVKKMNRMLEHRLRQLEFLCSCLPLGKYPSEQLDAIWKKVLINQFHDILPGSSINRTYRVTHTEHEWALEQCDQLQAQVAELLFERADDTIVFFNSLSFPFVDAVALPPGWSYGLANDTGQEISVQREDDRLVALIRVAPLSFVTMKRTGPVNSEPLVEDDLILENEFVRYEFDANGQLVDAYDKEHGRSILARGQAGNVLAIYDDHPLEWDAWDIEIYYETSQLQQLKANSAKRIADGPVRQGLWFRYHYGQSLIEQKVFLTSASKRLDFQTRVDWHEKHRMLRVSFAVNVISDQASFDIPYGYIRRSTHRNTSWDVARFEVAAQRYADLSDQDYGVALLNDSKYGYKVLDNVLDLNLLRSTNYPDPDADQGEHEFTYSLLPHTGDLTRSDVMEQAAILNQRVAVFEGYKAGADKLPVRLRGDGLSLEVLKKAEKEDSLIIRVVEVKGRQATGQLLFDGGPHKLVETNLMEWTEEKHYASAGATVIELAPFEIKTFKILSK